MNYQAHYDNLIKKYGTWEKPEGVYTERHRKLAGCMGGKYVKGNAFYMEARAHFVAHQLLVKIFADNKDLKLAAFKMSVMYRYGSKEYSWLKHEYALSISGDNNPAKRDIVRQKISDNNAMKTESGRLSQKEACNTEAIKLVRSFAVSGDKNPSCLLEVKIKRALNLKKRIEEGSMNRGVVWTPEIIAKRTDTKRAKKEEAHTRGDKYGAPEIHHTQTPEGKLKHIEAAKLGWITRKVNQK